MFEKTELNIENMLENTFCITGCDWLSVGNQLIMISYLKI